MCGGVYCLCSIFHSLLSLVKRWKEFVAVRSDANTMFDLCSDTESPKTIKKLRDVVDSLSAKARAKQKRLISGTRPRHKNDKMPAKQLGSSYGNAQREVGKWCEVWPLVNS